MEFIEIDGFYSTMLVKPKQLVEIKYDSIKSDDNRGMTINKSMVLDMLLHSLQTFQHNNKDVDIKDLYNKWFTIKYSKFLELYDSPENKNKKCETIAKNSKQMENIRNMRNITNFIMNIRVESRSQNGMVFESMVLFPNVYICEKEDIIEFKANTEIINAMFSKDKIIGIENKNKAKASYIKYDYNEVHRYSGMSLVANKLYCLILSNMGMFQEYGKFSINIEDLKDIICIESDRNSYVKNKIELAMVSVNNYLKENYSLKFLTGYRNRISSVTITNDKLKKNKKVVKLEEDEVVYPPEEIMIDEFAYDYYDIAEDMKRM